MKSIIGVFLMKVGSRLWQNGGWTGYECYNDLTAFGKLGYNMFCEGGKLIWGSLKKFEEAMEETANLTIEEGS